MNQIIENVNQQTNLIDQTLFHYLKIPVANHKDAEQLHKIILEYLDYPDSQKSEIHLHANRLGNLDIVESNKNKVFEQTGVTFILIQNLQRQQQIEICQCCGMKKQTQYISLCTKFENILNVGDSVNFFFNSIKNGIQMMIILTIIYSSFSIATNIISSSSLCNQLLCSSIAISLSVKQLDQNMSNKYYYMIQSWLGLILVISWGIYFYYVGYNQRKIQISADVRNQSPSDFSILIQNAPADICNKQVFQRILNDYYKTIEGFQHEKIIQGVNENQFFQIQKFMTAEPFYQDDQKHHSQEDKQMKQQYEAKLTEFREWIVQRIENQKSSFSVSEQTRNIKYREFQELETKIVDRHRKVRELYLKKYQEGSSQINDQKIIVSFKYSKARYLINKLNRQFLKDKLRDYFSLSSNRFPIDVLISRAPQPEDIIWQNIDVPRTKRNFRKFITFSITVIMLCISFAVLYGLSILSDQNKNNQIISFLLSIIVTVINVIIAMVLQYLTVLQRNFTKTDYQRSLAVKIISAQLINTIIVIFISDHFIKKNIYYSGGLAQDVFYLGISNSFVAPFIRLLNPTYYISKLLIWYYNRPLKKLELSQQKLNSLHTLIEFQIGLQYVYVIKTLIFTSFFVSLQPILSIFAIIGLLITYWVQKWILFKQSNRPARGTDILKNAMNQLIFFCPIIFSLGCLTWPTFLPNGGPDLTLLPNLISVGMAILFFLMPIQIIFSKCIHKPKTNLIYEQSRIFFTTEYDRLNPLTAKQGNQQFMQYLTNYKKNQEKSTSNKQILNLINLLVNENQQEKQKKMKNRNSIASVNHSSMDSQNFFLPLKNYKVTRKIQALQQEINQKRSQINKRHYEKQQKKKAHQQLNSFNILNLIVSPDKNQLNQEVQQNVQL